MAHSVTAAHPPDQPSPRRSEAEPHWKARREAEREATLLIAALTTTGHPGLAAQLRVRPVLAIVGGRVLVTEWTPGVAVVMTRELLGTLTAMPDALDPTQVGVIYNLARHRAVWTRPTD